MPLKPTGQTDDILGSELKKKLEANAAKKAKEIKDFLLATNSSAAHAVDLAITQVAAKDHEKTNETKLEEQRETQNQEPPVAIHENQLENEPVANRKDEPKEELMEGQLRGHDLKHAPNKDLEGTLEQRLNEASKTLYPHRNPAAYERTGDKRPINALPEENPKGSDEAKDKRYEKASKGSADAPERLVDKNVGEQLTNDKTTIRATFNRKKQVVSSMIKSCPAYLDYKEASSDPKFAEVREVDGAMQEILKTASTENRHLTIDERAQVAALKLHKTSLLK